MGLTETISCLPQCGHLDKEKPSDNHMVVSELDKITFAVFVCLFVLRSYREDGTSDPTPQWYINPGTRWVLILHMKTFFVPCMMMLSCRFLPAYLESFSLPFLALR